MRQQRSQVTSITHPKRLASLGAASLGAAASATVDSRDL
jgi:hypothetical protein